LVILSYLVLPQTQGAKMIYQDHIHPFLTHYERDIDNFISNAHDHAKAAGLQYLKRAIEFVKENVFGIPAKAHSSPPPSSHGSYAQNLLSRFNLPSARDGLAAPAGDFYGLLGATLAQATKSGASREAQVEEMSASGTLIPPHMTSSTEKIHYISAQRDRLRVLLSALDKEANSLSVDERIAADVEKRIGAAGPEDGLKKSKSEAEFDTIDRHEAGSGGDKQDEKSASGGWMPWNWGAKLATSSQESE
jgi:receptor expression-enhancing protein 1/2/3/4